MFYEINIIFRFIGVVMKLMRECEKYVGLLLNHIFRLNYCILDDRLVDALLPGARFGNVKKKYKIKKINTRMLLFEELHSHFIFRS